MKVLLIRHGMTKGNAEKRFIGITDEPLSEVGRQQLLQYKKQGKYPEADVLFSSPLKRCLQTAKLLYPALYEEKTLIENFRECNFGIFENKNHQELNGNKVYQKWIDAGGEETFPGGENPTDFKKRSIAGFKAMLRTVRNAGQGYGNSAVLKEEMSQQTIAAIVHGGIIMAVLEHYAKDGRKFYDFHTENGEGYILCPETGEIREL